MLGLKKRKTDPKDESRTGENTPESTGADENSSAETETISDPAETAETDEPAESESDPASKPADQLQQMAEQVSTLQLAVFNALVQLDGRLQSAEGLEFKPEYLSDPQKLRADITAYVADHPESKKPLSASLMAKSGNPGPVEQVSLLACLKNIAASV